MVDPGDTIALRRWMQQLLENRAEAQRLGILGIERARQFTWGACAEKTLAIYQKAVQGV